MSIFFARDKRSILVVDVASGSVAIGLAGLESGAIPRIVYASRQKLSAEADTPALRRAGLLRILRSGLDRAFKQALPALREAGLPIVLDHAVVSLSSADPSFARSVEDRIIAAFGVGRGVKLATYPSVLSRLYELEQRQDVIFVDIGTHETEILTHKDGAPTFSTSVPFGLHTAVEMEEREGERLWNGHWRRILEAYGRAPTHVFISSEADVGAAQALVSFVLSGTSFIPVPDDRLSILSAFSNIFL